jgi:hypothetical protein
MLYEVWIKKHSIFTIIREYAVFAGGHFEIGLENHSCNGNSTGVIFYVPKYNTTYMYLEDH